VSLGRFMSADPLVMEPGDPQMLDRYAYVRNNPLRYIDPMGPTSTTPCPPCLRAASSPWPLRLCTHSVR